MERKIFYSPTEIQRPFGRRSASKMYKKIDSYSHVLVLLKQNINTLFLGITMLKINVAKYFPSVDFIRPDVITQACTIQIPSVTSLKIYDRYAHQSQFMPCDHPKHSQK